MGDLGEERGGTKPATCGREGERSSARWYDTTGLLMRLTASARPIIIRGRFMPSAHAARALPSGIPMADHFTLRLVDSFMLAPTVRHLVFERVDGQPLAFQPGQFLQVHFH